MNIDKAERWITWIFVIGSFFICFSLVVASFAGVVWLWKQVLS